MVIATERLGRITRRTLISKRNGKLKDSVRNVNYGVSKGRIKLYLYELRIAKLNSELVALLVLAVKMLVNLIAVRLEFNVAVFTYKL